MTFVILSGGIDLSVGAVAGLCGMVAGYLLEPRRDAPGDGRHGLLQRLARRGDRARAGMAARCGERLADRAALRVAPFIATLGMLYVARGAAMLMSGRCDVSEPRRYAPALGNTGFPSLGTGTFLGIPVPIWLMVVLAAAGDVPRDPDTVRPAGLRHRRQRAGGAPRRRPCPRRSSSAST